MTVVSHKIGVGVLAALGLSALSPLHQVGLALSVSGAGLWSSSASAGITFGKRKTSFKSIGVGTIIKKVTGDASIIVATDSNGEVSLLGLEPGDYEIAALRNTAATAVRKPTIMKVGADGKLAFVARQGTSFIQFPFSGGSVGMTNAKAAAIDLRQTFAVAPPAPCARPQPGVRSSCPTSVRTYIDINSSSAEEIRRLAPAVSEEAAAIIVAERTRARFTGLIDFAARVCSRVAIDFEDNSVLAGDTRIVMKRGDQSKAAGFNCEPGSGVVKFFDVTGSTRQAQLGLKFKF